MIKVFYRKSNRGLQKFFAFHPTLQQRKSKLQSDFLCRKLRGKKTSAQQLTDIALTAGLSQVQQFDIMGATKPCCAAHLNLWNLLKGWKLNWNQDFSSKCFSCFVAKGWLTWNVRGLRLKSAAVLIFSTLIYLFHYILLVHTSLPLKQIIIYMVKMFYVTSVYCDTHKSAYSFSILPLSWLSSRSNYTRLSGWAWGTRWPWFTCFTL